MERDIFKTDKKIEVIREYWKTNVWVKKWFIKWYTTFQCRMLCISQRLTGSYSYSFRWAQSRIKYFEDDGEIYYLNSLEHFLLTGVW